MYKIVNKKRFTVFVVVCVWALSGLVYGLAALGVKTEINTGVTNGIEYLTETGAKLDKFN